MRENRPPHGCISFPCAHTDVRSGLVIAGGRVDPSSSFVEPYEFVVLATVMPAHIALI